MSESKKQIERGEEVQEDEMMAEDRHRAGTRCVLGSSWVSVLTPTDG